MIERGSNLLENEEENLKYDTLKNSDGETCITTKESKFEKGSKSGLRYFKTSDTEEISYLM